MSDAPRRVPASRGWSWLVAAVRMIRRWPSVFLPMGLIVAAIQLVPLLGGLALLIVGPALVAGSVTAAHTAASGGTPAIRQLFALFARRNTRSEGLKLCLPLLAGKILAVTVIATALLHRVSQSGVDVHALEANPERALALLTGGDMSLWLALAVLIILVAWTFAVLAIPRVALTRESAFTAMAYSVRQVWRSLAAWIVVAVVLFIGIMLLTMLLMLTHWLLVVQVGLFTALYAFAGPLLYAAWQDYGGAAPATTRRDQPPPPPDVLEA